MWKLPNGGSTQTRAMRPPANPPARSRTVSPIVDIGATAAPPAVASLDALSGGRAFLGIGERKTLRLVARYADGCNLFAFEGTAALAHKLDVLRQHCEDEGRDFGAIRLTATTRLSVHRDGRPGSIAPAQAIDEIHALAELGFDLVECILAGAHEEDAFDAISADVIPAIAKL